jgi:hypothetical protein
MLYDIEVTVDELHDDGATHYWVDVFYQGCRYENGFVVDGVHAQWSREWQHNGQPEIPDCVYDPQFALRVVHAIGEINRVV